MSYFLAPDAARTAARGLALSYPDVRLSEDPLYLWSAGRHPARRVALVSGGGSGHDLLHTGLLGPGGLDAVVPGETSASPTARQIVAASRTAARDTRAVLHIVRNQPGDRLAFTRAAERLHGEHHQVAHVVVGDDAPTGGHRAGGAVTAHTVIVEKILGAAADRGLGLDQLTALGYQVAAGSRSATGTGDRVPGPAQGRRGHGRGAPCGRSARGVEELVGLLLDELLDQLPADESPGGGDGMLLLVNGLGATGDPDLRLIGRLAHARLTDRGITVSALATDTSSPALNTEGFTLTLTSLATGWLDLWYAPTRTPLRLPGPAALPHPSTITPAASAPAPSSAPAAVSRPGAGPGARPG
ncbi:dihydroxyacetone kinase subunit DhaK, partial [Streptomyces sp. NPDC055078]